MKEQQLSKRSHEALIRESLDPALFDAVLEPHRSLNPQGFLILMAAVVVVSFAAGMMFIMIGAWPVFAFFALDVVLIYLAFRINYHGAKMYETVRLTEEKLTVVRVSASGRVQKWSFQPYWLKINIDETPGRTSKLVLTSHGKSLAIGSFLTPSERLDLARALELELLRLREPPPMAASPAE